MHAGPCLNQKISSALLHLRFDDCLLCFDLKKAFLQISLSDNDANKLLFLWYKNVSKRDFSLVTYKHVRLPFGLRCSPFLLMMAMHQILCLDAACDEAQLRTLKSLIYSLTYVDNGAISGTASDIKYAYEKLQTIFSPYKFEVQQLTTNEITLQTTIDSINEDVTPTDVKLLGLVWNREKDLLSTKPLNFDVNARTKRSILSSIAKQYDVHGFHAPLMVRARLFMHSLQCNKKLGWDDELSGEAFKQWKLIARQANSALSVQINRCIGNRNGCFELLCYTDASKHIYAVVIYLRDLKSDKISFVCAKNRIVNSQLQTKSIPTLELQAVSLGVEIITDLRNELSGKKCLFPINIVSCKLFTDSQITLHWLNAYNHKLDKMQKQTVFVHNRLEYIARQCDKNPITFCFTSTTENPADCLTRPCSYKQLLKTSFLSGISVESSNKSPTVEFTVTVPDPGTVEANIEDVTAGAVRLDNFGPLLDVNRYSSFAKLVRVTLNVMKFIHYVKRKIHERDSSKFYDFTIATDNELYSRAYKHVTFHDQVRNFPNLFEFLHSKTKHLRDIPSLVSKLNVFIDTDGLLRVKSKFDRWKSNPNYSHPILLAKDNLLTTMIIRDTHIKFAHAGCYGVLTQLRMKFFIPSPFSSVKKVLKECLTCK